MKSLRHISSLMKDWSSTRMWLYARLRQPRICREPPLPGNRKRTLMYMARPTSLRRSKEAWASLFTARAIFYRATNKFDHFRVAIAIPVQRMIESAASGIMFTIDPVTNDKRVIVIEAIHGLGEMIVQGAVTPDHYEVDKATFTIKMKTVKTQEKKMVKKGNGNEIQSISKKMVRNKK